MNASDVPVVAYDFEAGERAIQPAKGDGRSRRSIQTEAAILQACRTCMTSGDFRPTTVVIARVAGVSIRTVFERFTNLEQLYREALDQPTRDAIRNGILRECLPVGQADTDRLIAAVVFGRA